VSEAARNIVCTGGEPCAITNCLNFGNPYNPEVYWQFVNAIKGMGEACRKFDTPVTGGNVSFYNQSSDDGPVFPTPVIGMLGIMEDMKYQTSLAFKNTGDLIYLIGESKDDISASEYLANICGHKISPAPSFDLEEEFELQKTVKQLIRAGLIQSAHDCSDGGLFVALTESAIAGNKGFDITTDESFRKDTFLFGEAQSRVVVTVTPEQQDAFIELMSNCKTDFSLLGEVHADTIHVDNNDFGHFNYWKELYDNTIAKQMAG